jgi:ribosomal-protein-alanine N-acetyltransferase
MSILKTNRLLLRPLTPSDAAAMFKNWTFDERAAKYCTWYPHKSINETEMLLKMYLDQQNKGFNFRWGIVLQESNELIGVIDVVSLSDNKKSADIGYVLGYEFWNKGYATEALSVVIEKLFADGIETVKARHHIDNIASGKVMEKCGMKFTHNDKAKRKFDLDDTCDIRCYEIKK